MKFRSGAEAVRYRAFRMRDYRRVLALWKTAPEGLGLNESDRPKPIAAFLKRNPGLSLVATADRRIVAAVLCGHDGRRGYLHHLVVAPEWRTQGIGRELVARCLANLRALGLPKCTLFLYVANRQGAAFWSRIGWAARADLRVVQRATGTPMRPWPRARRSRSTS